MSSIDATEARISSHEEICALRYEIINARLKRLESILITACGVLLTGMGGMVFTFITHGR
jgi:hypothetical protein